MVRDGQLLQNRRGGYVPAERLDLIPGTVIANPNGFGFMRPDSGVGDDLFLPRSEEHTSELQSLMRISYAVFCLKKKKNTTHYKNKDYRLPCDSTDTHTHD